MTVCGHLHGKCVSFIVYFQCTCCHSNLQYHYDSSLTDNICFETFTTFLPNQFAPLLVVCQTVNPKVVDSSPDSGLFVQGLLVKNIFHLGFLKKNRHLLTKNGLALFATPGNRVLAPLYYRNTVETVFTHRQTTHIQSEIKNSHNQTPTLDSEKQ